MTELLTRACNFQVQQFIQLCSEICFPITVEKTQWASTIMTFLGMLLDSQKQIVSIPSDKIAKGLALINKILNNEKNKTTKKHLEQLTGFLNFLGRAIVPGRAFTRRLYAYIKQKDKSHFRIYVNAELKADLRMWQIFLSHPSAYCRSFFEFDRSINSDEIFMATDASANSKLGAGGVCQSSWFIHQWDSEFIEQNRPSINYLELYAATIGILNWVQRFKNRTITIFCDNTSVVSMINNTSSSGSKQAKLRRGGSLKRWPQGPSPFTLGG